MCSDGAVWLVDHLDLTFFGSGFGGQEFGAWQLLLVDATQLLCGY